MTLAAGALSKVLIGSSTASLSSAVATGGTGPYTYQWYRSTTSGFTPGAGNLVSGATGLTLADSGINPGTVYYYVVQATDTGAGNVTANSTQLLVTTQPSLQPNQFAQGLPVGMVDLKVGTTDIIACQVGPGFGPIYPGQAVKIVANTNGGVPQVQPISGKADQVIGFVRFNQKDIQYNAGQLLEICRDGTILWLYATAAVAAFAEVCVDPTYIGGVQPTGNTATFVGTAIDGCAAAGLIRVQLVDNASYATA